MNRLLLTSGVLALCGSSIAQSWSPLPAYQSKTGDGYQYAFGQYPLGRYQLVDGNFRNAALVVTKISMRVDDRLSYSVYTGMGRVWQNVNVDIAPAKLASLTGNFSANHMSTPTKCFSGSMVWPTLTGTQKNPLTNYSIQVPLTAPYINTGGGTHDLLVDFRMSGGALANNAVWTDRSPRPYYTDGYLITSYKFGAQRFWHDSSTAGCADSSTPPPFGRAYTNQYVQRFAATYPSPSYRNQVRVYNWTNSIGASVPFVNVVDLGIHDAGIPFGAGCERLFLKVSPAALFFPAVSNRWGQGPQNLFGLPLGLVKYDKAWKGLEIFTQSAWNDSRTNAVKLSAASSAIMPDFEFENTSAARRACVYHFSHGSKAWVSLGPGINPIIRYN
jgi:hypothetical protein